MRFVQIIISTIGMMAVLSAGYGAVAQAGEELPKGLDFVIPIDSEQATIDWVYDGDTIEVILGNGVSETVRLTGIDAPETGANFTTKQCFGDESTEHLRTLLSVGQTVFLERDVSDRDRYGRLVRFVWIDEGDRGVMTNVRMLEDGYAFAHSYGDDRKRSDLFWDAASRALEHNLGMWAACPDYRGDS